MCGQGHVEFSCSINWCTPTSTRRAQSAGSFVHDRITESCGIVKKKKRRKRKNKIKKNGRTNKRLLDKCHTHIKERRVSNSCILKTAAIVVWWLFSFSFSFFFLFYVNLYTHLCCSARVTPVQVFWTSFNHYTFASNLGPKPRRVVCAPTWRFRSETADDGHRVRYLYCDGSAWHNIIRDSALEVQKKKKKKKSKPDVHSHRGITSLFGEDPGVGYIEF